MERNLPYQRESFSNIHTLNNSNLVQNPDVFAFLKADGEQSRPKSFFSQNGLSQDIIQVTDAEPDICLEVFYALYAVLYPQIEKQSNILLKDTWIKFIGGSYWKGILCPPEKLIKARTSRDIQKRFSQPGGESQIFEELDRVMDSISQLKRKVIDCLSEPFLLKEILASLDLAETFYRDYRNKMKALVLAMIEKEKANASYMEEHHRLEDLLEPKAIMMSESFSYHWAYRISRSRAQKLLSLDLDGRALRNYQGDSSNHRIIALPEMGVEPLVYFKANGNPAIQPEKEFMLESLYRHFQIPVPETALLILTNVFETNPEYFYAVQASEAVRGESSLSAYRNPETIFDHEAYVAQVFGALLTNPSDGPFKNFQYSPKYQTFISIDNDLVFKPELVGDKIVNVKSILYLLPQIDLPIPESIKTLFTSVDPQLTIFSWLHDLSKKNREYQLLFARLTFQKTRCIYQNLLPMSEVPSLSACLQENVHVDSELFNHFDPFDPKIFVSQSLLKSLREKLHLIGNILEKNSSTNIQALFEVISPFLGKYYRKLRLEFELNDIEEALEALWGIKKNGIDYSEISSLLSPEEISLLPSDDNYLSESILPGDLIQEYLNQLASGESPLDLFIRRQNFRKKKNTMNLRITLKVLQLLTQVGLTNSRSISDIVDFRYSISKLINQDPSIIREIISILSNLSHAELGWLLMLEKYFLRGDQDVPEDLIPSSRAILGAFMKQRTFLLTESESQYLFDEQGNIQKNASLTGRSLVTFFPEGNPEFYLKQYPECPGYEFASVLFMRLIGIQNLPYQEFIILNSKCPVLLTQKVSGSPVCRIWQKSEAFSQLDPFHTGLLIISAMLLNPEDGHADNFILSQDGRYLIPIDHEHWFLPSFSRKEATFWNPLTVNAAFQAQTLLFCLNEMRVSIPSDVKNHILSIDFDQLLISWLAEIDKLENKLYNLINSNQREEFLKQGTVMRIPFHKQFILNLYWKAHKIQDVLKTANELTPFDLFNPLTGTKEKHFLPQFFFGIEQLLRYHSFLQ